MRFFQFLVFISSIACATSRDRFFVSGTYSDTVVVTCPFDYSFRAIYDSGE